MLIGAGNVISGAVFVFGATWINKLNRTLLLAIYFIIHVTAFSMIFVNIPVYANQGETYDPPAHLDKPNKALALISAFLLGTADAGIMNVIYTTVPIIWGNKSLSAYGLCQMFQTIGAAVSFGIAALISLWIHMGIMIGIGVLAFTGYVFLRKRDTSREVS